MSVLNSMDGTKAFKPNHQILYLKRLPTVTKPTYENHTTRAITLPDGLRDRFPSRELDLDEGLRMPFLLSVDGGLDPSASMGVGGF